MSGKYPYRRAGAVIVAGTVVWFVGISPVSRVYITPDAAERLRMLQAGQRGWVVGQHLTAAGTVAVPVGFAAYASAVQGTDASHRQGKKWAVAAAAALLAGAPPFVYSLTRRASDLERFADRRGSNAPFLLYSGLHVVALAALGGSLLTLPAKRWIGITAAASAPVYGAILVAKKDIPPFCFYLVEGLTGAYLMTWKEPKG
ncbi:hypothetical protein FQP90_07995 [Paenarthrobacter nitroguajacolicus]|uniref:Uncharacterized protein n=1 Tax=Paenarthrobacter nitroguajacolicus TaxID=211146 RepID=A0A558H477_PAENT|nr:hypothetical protein [Paenarthrobacter nitroguajacolicus]TVU63926.1 hypothetical protein FQP90_07995 [Paenarthrobacter nitroguajacolicus]